MARTARGAATLIDVQDGTNPITAFLTNENHTFAAESTGTISADSISGFSSQIVAFVGDTQATYSASTATPNTFRITGIAYSGTSTGWGTPTFTSGGVISIPSISTTAVSTASAVVTFSVTNSLGNPVPGLTQTISLSIVKEGTGGAIIEMTATRQNFLADNSGTLNAGQDDIILGVETQGLVGNLVVSTSVDGAAFATQSATGNGVGGVSAFDVDSSGSVETTGSLPNTFERLAISQTNLGSADTLTVRVAGAGAGGTDSISIFKVRDGAEGASAIIVSVDSNNGLIFRNSAGADKVLTATVFDADDGTQISAGNVYTWTRSGSGSVSASIVRVTSSTDRTVVAQGGVEASGTAFPDIIIGSADVDANEQFTCEVTTAT